MPAQVPSRNSPTSIPAQSMVSSSEHVKVLVLSALKVPSSRRAKLVPPVETMPDGSAQ